MTAQALTELNRPETAAETGGAYVLRQYLRVSEQLAGFVESEVLPGTGIAPESFWQGLAAIAATVAPRNRALLERRQDLQRLRSSSTTRNRTRRRSSRRHLNC